jgi:hypothetical protein
MGIRRRGDRDGPLPHQGDPQQKDGRWRLPQHRGVHQAGGEVAVRLQSSHTGGGAAGREALTAVGGGESGGPHPAPGRPAANDSWPPQELPPEVMRLALRRRGTPQGCEPGAEPGRVRWRSEALIKYGLEFVAPCQRTSNRDRCFCDDSPLSDPGAASLLTSWARVLL